MSHIDQLFAGSITRNRTLEELPSRVLTLLRGIAGSREIRQTMNAAGFTVDVQDQGYDLLKKATGFGQEGAPAAPLNPSAAAIEAVSAWYAPSFDRIGAALRHMHPEEATYVLQGLVSVTGVAAIPAADVLLDRLADLAGTGPNAAARKSTAKADKKAMATLALRGFDAAELKTARGLVDDARHATAEAIEPVDLDAQQQRLLTLKTWYDDWSTTAHALIKKRADLIKIGLAHPRAAKTEPPPAPAPTPPATGSTSTAVSPPPVTGTTTAVVTPHA